MIAQHEQQHGETMLATHQLRSGAAGAVRPPTRRAPAARWSRTRSRSGWGGRDRNDHGSMGARQRTSRTPRACARVPHRHRARHQPSLPRIHGRRRLPSARIVERDRLGAPARRRSRGPPQFWTREHDGTWWRRRFGVAVPVHPDEPVVHVCFHEADAYARWAGETPAHGSGVGDGRAMESPPGAAQHPLPVGGDASQGRNTRISGSATSDRGRRRVPGGRVAAGRAATDRRRVGVDVVGLRTYPGFRAFPYREYSEVFFGGDYRVLRGGSFGTDTVACRGTFRNWDHPIRRQIFAGFRCARDLPVPSDVADV